MYKLKVSKQNKVTPDKSCIVGSTYYNRTSLHSWHSTSRRYCCRHYDFVMRKVLQLGRNQRDVTFKWNQGVPSTLMNRLNYSLFKINTWREDKFERSVANGTETVFVTLRFCVVRKQLKATLKPNAAGVQLPPHYYRNGWKFSVKRFYFCDLRRFAYLLVTHCNLIL